MNRRATLLLLVPLLLLPVFTEAGAQIVSPVINYQGRAQDAAGEPLTGERAIMIRIYGAQSGGTPLFSESHPSVTFNGSGIFTLVIGGNTPGGIPQSIGFDQPRWLGVTIEGFNDGNELPRLRFYGTSYSFEANHAFEADRADSANSSATAVSAATATTATTADSSRAAFYADSTGRAGMASRADHAVRSDSATTAVGLLLPAIQAFTSISEPTLRIVNGSGRGLEVEGGIWTKGSPYAIVSDGADSTTKHYATAEVVGSAGTPNPGSLYRDNVPLAWGQIAADGTIISDFGILRVAHTPNSPGVYQVYLDNSVTTGDKGEPHLAVVITPRYIPSGQGGQLVFPHWNYATDQTGTTRNDAFQVDLRGFESGVDVAFSVVVFGRTEK